MFGRDGVCTRATSLPPLGIEGFSVRRFFEAGPSFAEGDRSNYAPVDFRTSRRSRESDSLHLLRT